MGRPLLDILYRSEIFLLRYEPLPTFGPKVIEEDAEAVANMCNHKLEQKKFLGRRLMFHLFEDRQTHPWNLVSVGAVRLQRGT